MNLWSKSKQFLGYNCRNLYINAQNFLGFLTILSMCFMNLRPLSVCLPTYLHDFDSLLLCLSQKQCMVALIQKKHCFSLLYILFKFIIKEPFWHTPVTLSIIWLVFHLYLILVVSSANVANWLSLIHLFKSFIWNKEKSGPKTYPWGLSVVFCIVDFVSFRLMYCHRLFI